jgi:hypothetical protein
LQAEPQSASGAPLQIAGSRGGSSSRKVLANYTNNQDVKPFIGTPLSPSNLPPGYEYGKIPLGNGQFREVIYLKNANSNLAPLKVDAKGNIQLAAEGNYRIVNSSAYNKNIQTIPGKVGKLLGRESQVHHLIPDNVVRDLELTQEAMRRGIYNPDRTSNLIELATKNIPDSQIQAIRSQNPTAQLPTIRHYSSHPDYDKLVKELVKQALKGRNVRQLSDSEILNVLNIVEQQLRGGFLGTGTLKLPLNPDGRLVQNENNPEGIAV